MIPAATITLRGLQLEYLAGHGAACGELQIKLVKVASHYYVFRGPKTWNRYALTIWPKPAPTWRALETELREHLSEKCTNS